MSNTDFIEVPPPLYKYEGDDVIHEDNQKLLDAYQANRKVILAKSLVKHLRLSLVEIEKQLTEANAYTRIAEFDSLLQEFNSARLRLNQTPELADMLKAQKKQLVELGAELKPYRLLVVKRNKIESKLKSHYTALQEEQKESELLSKMAKEALIISDQIRQTLARIGFKETIHYMTRGGQRSKTYYVEFERCITTPDQHQFKIAANRQGLLGGTVELLPDGTHVTEILTERVMRELSTALEREVWTPHINEDVSNSRGAWIVVERMGLYEGIPKSVTYKQIMARYETAEHESLPLPLGLKRGRRVNWTYLDSHASTHIMFTGITGSGKTNAIQAAIAAIVEKQSPRDVLFMFIDLKNQGDFNELAAAPHLIDKNIITDIPDVVEALKKIRSEMHWRQRRIGSIAKNIKQYNHRVKAEDRLPRIVILFDEYANTRRDRFGEHAAIIDDICIEITQIGRASGIHLWLGIQQPRASNMPQALRDNFTTLFIGHQANIGAAQSVTGNRTSLRLPDFPGRMLAYVGWQSFEVQMPLITDGDINNAVSTAQNSYGDIPPYQLHYLDDDEAPPPILTDRDLIIQIAFERFEGALKTRAIWEQLKPKFSLNQVTALVKEITSGGAVEYDGLMWKAVKQPSNFYVFELLEADT